MPVTGLLLAIMVGACSPKGPHGAPSGPSQTDVPEPGTTSPPAPTHHINDPRIEEYHDVVLTEIEPGARIIGLPGMKLYLAVAALPAHGGHPAVIFLENTHHDDDPDDAYESVEPFASMPKTLLVPGTVPPGDHLVTELWDGVSAFDTFGTFVSAGDVNSDGALDVWAQDRLHLGPFLGRENTIDQAIAWVEPVLDDDRVVLGGFDIDGDGHDDALFSPCCQLGIIRYGPFEGPISSFTSGFDPEDTVQLGSFDACWTGPDFFDILPDHLGPGHHALSVTSSYMCWPDTLVYDLQQPRGAVVPVEEAIAWNEGGLPLTDLEDLDQDGSPDVALTTPAGGSFIIQGPLSDFVNDLPRIPTGPQLIESSGISHKLGDLDGDGYTELLVVNYPEGSIDMLTAEWVVLFSPHTTPGPTERGVKIADYTELYFFLGGQPWVIADLDGDGLDDILFTDLSQAYMNPPPELVDAGELTIWYAKDILAAYQAALAAKSSPSSPSEAP